MTATTHRAGATVLGARPRATTSSGSRDLAAYDDSIRSDITALVADLRSALGAKLVAYLGSVSETRR